MCIRDSHKYSDQEEDVHSPLQKGWWFSHVGWILSADYMRTDLNLVRDFRRNPEICFLNKHYWIPPLCYALLMYGIWGFPGLLWGFFIATTAPVSYTHLRAHETGRNLVCRLLLEKKKSI